MREILAEITKQFVIPVLRHSVGEALLQTAQALANGGLRVIEVTLMNDEAYKVIETLSKDPTLLIGAGTVLNEQDARRAIDAGAKFLVSPGLDENSVIYALKRNIPFIPGVLTPTEVMKAQSIGCKMLKLFPASSIGGISYIKSLSSPFPDIKWMCTGGISFEDIKVFHKAGVACVGLGNNLAPPAIIDSKDWKEITKLAQLARELT